MWTHAREKLGRVDLKNKKFEVLLKEQLLQRFSCSLGNKVLFSNSGVEVPPYACEFAGGSSRLCLIADEEGVVSLFDTTSAAKLRAKWRCHRNAIFDVAWSGSNVFATASGDTTACLWDASSPGRCSQTLRGHSCSLKSVIFSSFHPNIIATGSRDGNAIVWDTRTTQPVIRFQGAHFIRDALTPQKKRRRADQINQLQQDSKQTVSSVAFSDTNSLITSGAMDGAIKIWDLRSSAKRSTFKSKKNILPRESISYAGTSTRRRGYSSLSLDSTHTRLFASCTDDTIYEFSISTTDCSKALVRTYGGHRSSSFYVKIRLSPDDQFLLSGSDDNVAYIWGTVCTDPIVAPCVALGCDGMEQVTSVDWCRNDWWHIVTCSDDCAARFWKLNGDWPRSHYDGFCKKLSHDVVSLKTNAPDLSVKKAPVPKTPLLTETNTPRFRQRQTSLSGWILKKNKGNFDKENRSIATADGKGLSSPQPRTLLEALGDW